MQTTTIRSLGFKALTKQVPSDVAEFDALAKEQGAAIREANRNVLYRSTLADFRDSYLHGSDEEKAADGITTRPAIIGLDKQFSIERKTKIKKPAVLDADGKTTTEAVETWDETEDEFFNRIIANLVSDKSYPSEEAAIAGLSGGAQSVLDSIAFDPSKSDRKSAGPKKTPKVYLDTAAEIVKATGSIESAIAAFSKNTGIPVTEITVEALAVAIWKDQTSQAKSKQLSAQYAQ